MTRRLDPPSPTLDYTPVASLSTVNVRGIDVARKKADSEKKVANPLSLRISPRASAALDELTTEFGLAKTAAVEVALIHLVETARKAKPQRAIALIKAEKKIPE